MIKCFLLSCLFLGVTTDVFSETREPGQPGLGFQIDLMDVFKGIDFSQIFSSWQIHVAAVMVGVIALSAGIYYVYLVLCTIRRALHNVRQRKESGGESTENYRDIGVRLIMLNSRKKIGVDDAGNEIFDNDTMMSREDAEKEWERRERKRRDLEFALGADAMVTGISASGSGTKELDPIRAEDIHDFDEMPEEENFFDRVHDSGKGGFFDEVHDSRNH